MDTSVESMSSKVPVHLWIVGGVSLLWNSLGAFDYLMTQLKVEAYMQNFTAEQLTYFYGFPMWADAAWALGVWGSVVGSFGLLLRRAWSRWAFAVSLLGLSGTTLYTMILTDGVAIMGGTGNLVFSAAIWAITIALLVYSVRMTRKGVLH